LQFFAAYQFNGFIGMLIAAVAFTGSSSSKVSLQQLWQHTVIDCVCLFADGDVSIHRFGCFGELWCFRVLVPAVSDPYAGTHGVCV
jgi:hypothetical protein